MQSLNANIPQHVAIIMDGNGRWATKRGEMRLFGHENAVQSVEQCIETAAKVGIKYLSLYAFSTENWQRPSLEIKGLLALIGRAIENKLEKIHQNNIKIVVIGQLEDFPKNIQKQLLQVQEKTVNNTRMTLAIALSYSGRKEIEKCMVDIATKIKNNVIDPQDINPSLINQHLYTASFPDIDLLIRTSGEHRISNFMLWQIAYAELYFTDVLWPDFKPENLIEAIKEYQTRDRRFGQTSEQIKNTANI